MTAVILPFARPLAHAASCPAKRLPRAAIDRSEFQEAALWAGKLGAPWDVAWVVGGPDIALSIRTPRCVAVAPDHDGETVSPWIIARTESGVVVLEDGWLEQGSYRTITAALARVLEVETRLAGTAMSARA